MTSTVFSRRAALALAGLAFAALAVPAVPAAAHGYKVGSLSIHHPWTRATAPGAKVAGGFLEITNEGKEADKLIGGTFVGSARFELHEMKVENGVMSMRPVAAGLEIPAGGKLTLKPGSYHVMFMDLKSSLSEGERVAGTLVFEKAGKVDIEFVVEAMTAKTSVEPAGQHQHGTMGH